MQRYRERQTLRDLTYTMDQLKAMKLVGFTPLPKEKKPTSRDTTWSEVSPQIWRAVYRYAEATRLAMDHPTWGRKGDLRRPLNCNQENVAKVQPFVDQVNQDGPRVIGRAGTSETGAEQFLRLYNFVTTQNSQSWIAAARDRTTGRISWRKVVARRR